MGIIFQVWCDASLGVKTGEIRRQPDMNPSTNLLDLMIGQEGTLRGDHQGMVKGRTFTRDTGTHGVLSIV